jgi:hypothetical protein
LLCEITFEVGSKLKVIGNYAFLNTAIVDIELPEKCQLITAFSL